MIYNYQEKLIEYYRNGSVNVSDAEIESLRDKGYECEVHQDTMDVLHFVIADAGNSAQHDEDVAQLSAGAEKVAKAHTASTLFSCVGCASTAQQDIEAANAAAGAVGAGIAAVAGGNVAAAAAVSIATTTGNV